MAVVEVAEAPAEAVVGVREARSNCVSISGPGASDTKSK